MKVMARLGHMPSRPGGRPWLSTRRQYSPRLMASCRMPAAGAPQACISIGRSAALPAKLRTRGHTGLTPMLSVQ